MMIHIIGSGLAGCEAAWQAAELGVPVTLYDSKPEAYSPAHHSPEPAELVCSNSLRAARVENAVGLLKYELRQLESLLLRAADASSVPAGGALAVDRDEFSKYVREALDAHPLITRVTKRFTRIPDEEYLLLATGPLTQGDLFADMQALMGEEHLHFFDAAAPIVSKESLDFSIVFAQSRYDKEGGGDYLNCPMNQEEYQHFYEALISAERAEVADFDREVVFEGCMPIETMASRGEDTMRFGPLKPVGLTDPRTGRRPYACVQLRQDDRQGEMYNIVGFQTRLKQGEQRRVFRMIPGLQKAEFLRYGVMHRNTYLHSPGHLLPTYELRTRPGLFFAGQMTGVEGYVESIASGLVAGINLAAKIKGEEPYIFPPETMIGAMAAYVSDAQVKRFQPMNANWGLVPPPEEKIKWNNKHLYWVDRARRALAATAERLALDKGHSPGQLPEIPLPEPKQKKTVRRDADADA